MDPSYRFGSNVLFIGNPPWVTNSQLGKARSDNLPVKANFKGLRGMDARTGKSNFDISEWMLLQILDRVSGTNNAMAFLVKNKVARNVVEQCLKNKLSISQMMMFHINAKKWFDASVDACLFVAKGAGNTREIATICKTYSDLSLDHMSSELGLWNNRLVSDLAGAEALGYVMGESEIAWRSGIKHDCSKGMELAVSGDELIGLGGYRVPTNSDFLFPILKSSDLANGRISNAKRYAIVTQRKIGAPTEVIQEADPIVWEYLLTIKELLDGRKSSIYKNTPPFSVFGVGDYSFAPFKVAVSGLYKTFNFEVIEPINGKEVMLDDTCYFLPFKDRQAAQCVCTAFNSEQMQNFFKAMTFNDSKRPITASLLNSISILSAISAAGLSVPRELSQLNCGVQQCLF